MKRRYMIPLLILVVLGIAYWAGPRLPRTELNTDLPDLPVGIDRISEYVQDREARLPVKPDNQGIILWGDSVAQPTTYVLLYLHGFTASRFEGQPIISDFVKEFRVNAYLPRLAAHGLQGTEAMLGMTPANLYNSAKEALVIAHKLGKKVIIMGTSTGCTLALMLAADFPRLVDALILYSPNIKIKNPMAPLLSGPWGLQISRAVHGGKYAVSDDPADDYALYTMPSGCAGKFILPSLQRVNGNMLVSTWNTSTDRAVAFRFPSLQSVAGEISVGHTAYKNRSVATLDFSALTAAGAIRIGNLSSVTDFSTFTQVLPRLSEQTWSVTDCGYNPTYQQMLDGETGAESK